MKKLICLIVILLTLILTGSVLAEIDIQVNVKEPEKGLEQESIINRQLEKLNMDDLEKEVDKINAEIEEYFPHLNIKDILLRFIKRDLDVDWNIIIYSILKYLGNEVTANFFLLGQIIILAVISAVLMIFQDSFSSQTISNTANILIYLILSVILLKSFYMAITIGVNAIDNMVSFMQALLPVLLTILVSMGAFASAVIFKPLTFLLISFFSTLIKNIILPMIFISVILNVVDHINSDFPISRLAKLFKEISMALLGVILVLMIGGLLLQGGAAAVTDSLSLRTAKYLTGTFIPVVGGMFANAVDLIVSCSLIIKNALNIFGVLAIILIIGYPVIKLVALIFIYKIASALVQPISDQRIMKILDDLGNGLIMVFLVVTAVTIMFFIVITVIVGTANLTVMMR